MCSENLYFVNFTNDSSRYGYIHLIKCWSEGFWFDQTSLKWSRKINLTRKSNSCDTDQGNKDLSYKVGISLEDLWEEFHKLRHMEHHSVMVCLDVVITFYWIMCGK
jgi:hypothetical protein